MNNTQRIILLIGIIICFAACGKHPSKVEQMRMEKAHKDSVTLAQAYQTRQYSDSMLQVLLPKADSLMRYFKYDKNESYEDHGSYVHKLLVTGKNDARNYLQAYVTDAHKVVLQSFFYGPKPIQQQKLKVSVDELYIEVEGSNHAFEAEGWHEVLSIEQDDAMKVLAFISSHQDERIIVTPNGKQMVKYRLQKNEIEALAATYELGLVMQDVATLERAIHVANRQIEKGERRAEEKQRQLSAEKKEK